MSSTPGPSYPNGAKIHQSFHLVSWHPRGVLDAAVGREILAFIEFAEAIAAEPFHRFTDFSTFDAIRLNFAEVEELARRRVQSYDGPHVKSAILAPNSLAFGIARMYEQLTRRSSIEVRVFRELATAATWLEIPIEVLEKP